MGFQEDLIKSLEEKRKFEEELKMANKKIKLLNMKLDRFAKLKKENEDWKEAMRIANSELEDRITVLTNEHEKLKDDYRIARNEIALLNTANEELKERLEFNKRKFEEYFSLWKDSSKAKADLENRIMVLTNDKTKLEEQVKFHKQKYDMAIATPTPTAAFEEEIKQLKDKVVLWKKDAEKSKEEAQRFREQLIKEANMKEKYSNEFDVMEAFYEVEKERAKKAEAESQKLLEELKKEKENSEYFSEKSMIAIETIKHSDKEIARLKEEVQKWKDTYSEEAQRPVEQSSKDKLRNLAALSGYPLKSFINSALKSALEVEEGMAQLKAVDINNGHIVTGTLEVTEEFKLPEVFAVMKHNAEDPELFSNPTEAIQRTEALNKEKDAYNIRTVRILKVK